MAKDRPKEDTRDRNRVASGGAEARHFATRHSIKPRHKLIDKVGVNKQVLERTAWNLHR
jgi:hypothetical protein